MTPAGHPSPRGLTSLANALATKYERTGEIEDLNEAITLYRRAINLPPSDYMGKAKNLANLGLALRIRFERIGAAADLDEAITSLRNAIAGTPAKHMIRADMLSNLGGALQIRFERDGAAADLDEAITVAEDALNGTPGDQPSRAVHLTDLGIALRLRSAHAGPAGTAKPATSMREGRPERATRKTADRDAAISVFAAAAEAGSAAPSVRIRAARAAADLLAPSQPGRAADLLDAAVRLLGEVAPRQLARSDQQFAIGGLAGLASDAAALTLAGASGEITGEERAERALALLEAGRAVLLSQALDTRDDLTDLRRLAPRLAERFSDLRDRLDQPDDSPQAAIAAVDATAAAVAGRMAHQRRSLARQLATTLAEIRSLEGFASFGLPPAVNELRRQAASGPVVTFNISTYRSDALLLTAAGVTSVELPGISWQTLIEQIGAFHQALHHATHAAERVDRMAAQDTLADILAWLWDNAAGPVLSALGYHQPPAAAEWPRVWWAPGGLLGLLPVHAAGHHAEPRAAGQARRTVMDRVVSSYTPTIRALRYARQHARSIATGSRALIVAMPATPGLPHDGRLPHVAAEAARLGTLLPDRVVLANPDTPASEVMGSSAGIPTKTAVFEYLPSCTIAHFACHAQSHPSNPSEGMLLLNDHASAPLTVASLAPVQHDRLELVYLSACSTAVTSDTRLLDESIHLASAFHLAGARHVIGTLWEVDDAAAADIAVGFYAGLNNGSATIDTGRSARALHLAISEARQKYPRTPSLWAAHLHVGA